MKAAVDSVLQEKRGLKEAARLHNIPVETLRRHVNGSVEVGDLGQLQSSLRLKKTLWLHTSYRCPIRGTA